MSIERKYFMKAMDLIYKAQTDGHLLMPVAFEEKYKFLPNFKEKYESGFTSNPSFEILPSSSRIYRIKENISASDAVLSLLKTNETYIECGVALNIAYYLVILWKMQDIHGKDKGEKRFNAFFGENTNSIPLERRLIISPSCLFMGVPPVPPELGQQPVQPLSFINKIVSVQSKTKIHEIAKIGSFIIFAGDPKYNEKHPTGSEGAYNCIITSLSPIKVRCIEEKEEVIEADLYKRHITAFNKKMPLLSYNRTSSEKIPGFCSTLVEFDEEKLNFILFGDVQSVISNLENYISKLNKKTVSLPEKMSRLKIMEKQIVPTIEETYDETITTTLVKKLKELNPNYTGGYLKNLHQVDGILPLSPSINIEDEIRKIKSLDITPMFFSTKLPGFKVKSNVLCIRDINGSNSEKVNKISF